MIDLVYCAGANKRLTQIAYPATISASSGFNRKAAYAALAHRED